MSDIAQGQQSADITPADATPAATPQREPRVRKLNIIGRRNVFFAISLLIIIPGMYFMATRGFAGGTEFTINFTNQPSVAQVEQAVAVETIHGQSIEGSVIQTDRGVFIVPARPMLPPEQKVVEDDLVKKLGPIDTNKLLVLEVGPTIAGETIQFALLAVVLASVAILFLLAIRFHNLPGGWRAGFQFGGSALAALLHDVFLLTGIFSIMGKVLNWRIGEIDSFFVVAVLTVVGFSVHDTIVVFDRIRENLRVSQRLSFEQVVNLSIMQTAARSIITSFTVVLVLVAILIAGGSTQKGLALALLIGIVSGTYSSIFNAAPLLVVWRRLQPLR